MYVRELEQTETRGYWITSPIVWEHAFCVNAAWPSGVGNPLTRCYEKMNGIYLAESQIRSSSGRPGWT